MGMNKFSVMACIISLVVLAVETAEAASLRGKSFSVRGTIRVTVCFNNTVICIPGVQPFNLDIYVGKSGTLFSYTGRHNGQVLSPNKTYDVGKQRNRFRVSGSNLHMTGTNGENNMKLVIGIRQGKCGLSISANSPKAFIKKYSSNLKCSIANGNFFAKQ